MHADAPLTDWIVHTAAKGMAVLVVALIAGFVLRKLAAARRYAVWITSVVALLLMPLASGLLPAWHVLPRTTPEVNWPVLGPEAPVEVPVDSLEVVETAAPVAVSTQTPARTEVPQPSEFVFSWEKLMNWLPAVWFSIAAFLLVRLAWSACCLKWLERGLKTGTSGELSLVAKQIGLPRVPKLLVGDAKAVPMVWGVWRTRLLLPTGFEQWSATKMRGVLLHELAHLKRRDPLALWAAQWVKALHWFNPLVWLTIRQLRADQERACDDAVLRHGIRASEYAQHLLDLSRHTRIAPGLALCALTITRCAPVETRVKAILDPSRRREPITHRWLGCLAGLALVATLPVAMLHAIEGAKLRGRILDRNGVVLAETTKDKVRHYPLKRLAAHALGYTGKSGPDDLTPEGRAGMEKQQDAALKSGADVSLTLDARIQSLTHRAMTEAGFTRGAAVVLDPRNGEILAAVSLPSYDLNIFIPSISKPQWEKHLSDRDLPLFDRCFTGTYVPGSAFKPLIGLAGIAAGTGERKFTCDGFVKYGTLSMQCWIHRQNGGKHGELSMPDALAASCNCFFYQFGNAAGIDQIDGMGRKVGFGSRYGIVTHESEGVLPSPAWMKENRPTDKWTDGYTANLSIGQGQLLVTPLQMAVLAATVGNGGRVPQPSLIKNERKAPWRADLVADGLPVAHIEQLREGMRLVVQGENGTGKAAQSSKVVIAGKTGTSQFWRQVDGQRILDNRTWFIGFAPFEKPTLAFVILKEGGKSGGSDGAPVAKRLVEEVLALPADGSGEVVPVGDAWEKIEAERTSFDAKAATISSEIDRAKPDAKSDFVLTELKIGHGEVTLHGTASGMIQALEFRANLVKIGDQFEIEWEFPVPKIMKDGKRVEFQVRGSYQPTNSSAADAPKKTEAAPKPASAAQIRQQSDDAIRMRPADADNWKFLKSKGLLADLPAEAAVPILSERDRQHSSGFFQFRFSAPRAAVRRWLLESLRVKEGHEEAFLNWPDQPAAFYRTYSVPNDCQIVVHCPEGETMHVSISKKKPIILIAPDEATPPMPKTAAPKELEGVVRVENLAPFVWPDSSSPFPLIHLQDPQSPQPQDELATALQMRASSYRIDKSLLVNRAAR